MAITQKTKDPATGTPLKISGTWEEWAVPTPHRPPLVTNLVIRHERGKDRIVITTNRT
jgi:hypothetical protein